MQCSVRNNTAVLSGICTDITVFLGRRGKVTEISVPGTIRLQVGACPTINNHDINCGIITRLWYKSHDGAHTVRMQCADT